MSATFALWNKFDPVAITKDCKVEDKLRRTKIVATIGPKTQTVEALEALIDAGVNVVRMNFSHGDHEVRTCFSGESSRVKCFLTLVALALMQFHQKTLINAKTAANNKKKIIAVMLDTKGPEIRTGTLEGGKEVELLKGQEFIITTEKIV